VGHVPESCEKGENDLLPWDSGVNVSGLSRGAMVVNPGTDFKFEYKRSHAEVEGGREREIELEGGGGKARRGGREKDCRRVNPDPIHRTEIGASPIKFDSSSHRR